MFLLPSSISTKLPFLPCQACGHSPGVSPPSFFFPPLTVVGEVERGGGDVLLPLLFHRHQTASPPMSSVWALSRRRPSFHPLTPPLRGG